MLVNETITYKFGKQIKPTVFYGCVFIEHYFCFGVVLKCRLKHVERGVVSAKENVLGVLLQRHFQLPSGITLPNLEERIAKSLNKFLNTPIVILSSLLTFNYHSFIPGQSSVTPCMITGLCPFSYFSMNCSTVMSLTWIRSIVSVKEGSLSFNTSFYLHQYPSCDHL